MLVISDMRFIHGEFQPCVNNEANNYSSTRDHDPENIIKEQVVKLSIKDVRGECTYARWLTDKIMVTGSHWPEWPYSMLNKSNAKKID